MGKEHPRMDKPGFLPDEKRLERNRKILNILRNIRIGFGAKFWREKFSFDGSHSFFDKASFKVRSALIESVPYVGIGFINCFYPYISRLEIDIQQ